MKTYRDISKVDAHKAVVTVGTYDGVHKGHQEVLDTLKNTARKIGGETVVLTFWPHPRVVIYPGERNLRLLNTLEEKIDLFKQAGIDHLIIYPFTRPFSRISSEEFVKGILLDKIGTHHLVVGYDHRFGSKREGGIDVLQRLARNYKFTVEQVGVLNYEQFSISSTQIRNALDLGDLDLASSFLGYNYHAHGVVSEGQKIGRSIGFPTANLKTEAFKLLPADGVYAVKARIDEDHYYGMANLGKRPTVKNPEKEHSFEIHLFDFDKKIYGKTVRVEFMKKIRDERKFHDLTELKFQLQRDKLNVQQFFKENNLTTA